MTFKKAMKHKVTIEAAINGGYLVTVGCQTLPYADKYKLIEDLSAYLISPEEMESAYKKAMDIPRLTVPNFTDIVCRKGVS
jgi:hypothetical protein